MSVVASDLKIYKPANVPADDTSTGGGAITATEIVGTVGELFPTMAANAEGGASKIWYYKCFFKNTNGATNLTNSYIYMKNGLNIPGSTRYVRITSTSANDSYSVSNMKAKVVGNDGSGVAVSEYITLTGVTPAIGAQLFASVYKVELRDATSDALVAANGEITIESYNSAVDLQTIGIIPATYKNATGEIDIVLSATLDDTGTIANRLTAPAGLVFPASTARPITVATALAVANSGTLTFGSAQGVWMKKTVIDGEMPSAETTLILNLIGDTT